MASVQQKLEALSASIDNHVNSASDATLEAEEDQTSQQYVRKHHLGVRPSGNAITSDQDLSFSMGSLGLIPDSLLLLFLEFLDPPALLKLGQTCKGLFAYCTYDQLWREALLREDADNLEWRGSWRASWLKAKSARPPKVDCRHLFSDVLYRPFQCTYATLTPYCSNIPGRNQIARLTDLTQDMFAKKWVHRPFILTDPVKKWLCYRSWDEKFLLEKYGQVRFRAEAVDWTLSNYIEYMNTTQDESPLYLFDRSFVEKMETSVDSGDAYEVPECFGEDLFMLLGEHRPDHRWLIVGPQRSGSTFHKDPNATSAWNAVIRGSKYWIMFPNSIVPPGVYMSDDQSEVTSPLSITEWLLTFHEEARRTPGCVEGVCGPGEVLYVPSGWWHLVVNLEPAIAITQNFVPKAMVSAAISFLKNKPEQVSGFKDSVQNPAALFLARLREKHPDLYARMNMSEKKRKWEDIVHSDGGVELGRGNFSFGFSGGNDDDDDLEEE